MIKPILVVGSAALDTVETPAGRRDNILGGSSFFFSTAASRFSPVRLVAVIGSDFPLAQLDFMTKRNVDLSGLETQEGETFRWGGKYFEDPNQRETLFTKLGVFERFEPKIPDHFKDSPIVFLGNIHPKLQMNVLEQIRDPELVVLDTMNFWIQGVPDLLENVISKTNVLIINDEESFQLTNQHNILSAAENLLSRGPHTIVIKKGQHGAVLIRQDGDIFIIPAFPVRKVIDPTGAGDTFAGGFVGYLASQDLRHPQSWRKAMAYGAIVASYVVEDFSMERTKILRREEIDGRLELHRKMTAF